jgi:hypothetical protein
MARQIKIGSRRSARQKDEARHARLYQRHPKPPLEMESKRHKTYE